MFSPEVSFWYFFLYYTLFVKNEYRKWVGIGIWTLRNSSGVSKGIDKPVVQSGRDFPYIRVGGGQ